MNNNSNDVDDDANDCECDNGDEAFFCCLHTNGLENTISCLIIPKSQSHFEQTKNGFCSFCVEIQLSISTS